MHMNLQDQIRDRYDAKTYAYSTMLSYDENQSLGCEYGGYSRRRIVNLLQALNHASQ